MSSDARTAAAAQLFKVLGNESRLRLMHLLVEQPRTVSALAEDTGMSQPLVSQHLRTLRQAELATAQRQGREMIYRATDEHVAHVIEDAFVHVHEPSATQAETTP